MNWKPSVIVFAITVACGGSSNDPHTAASFDARLDKACGPTASRETCQALERRAAARLFECNKAPATDHRFSTSCREERDHLHAVRARLADHEGERGSAPPVVSAAASPATSAARDQAIPAPEMTAGPPSDSEFRSKASASISQNAGSCPAPGRRVFARAEIRVRTSGAVEQARLTSSTFPRRTMAECLERTLMALSFKPYEMPPGKGLETECPPGTGSSPALMFKCKQVQRDYLRLDAEFVLEDDGKPLELKSIAQEDVTPVALGQDKAIIGREGVEGTVVAPREWPKDPSGAPRYCVEAGGGIGGRPSGKGWCFVISCGGDEDGLLGLSGPPGPGGNAICPKTKAAPAIASPARR